MMNLKYIAYTVFFSALIFACERNLDSEGITAGIISYPAMTFNGDEWTYVVIGEDTFTDPGVVATLGTEDITDQVVTSGTADDTTPGVYLITYTVSTENELGEASTVTLTRIVAVVSSDADNTDLSGSYIGTGFSSSPSTVAVTKLDNGFYNIEDVLSSSNGISADFAYTDGTEIVIPSQSTSFGTVNTTTSGASASTTADGFEWTVYISCCGLYGPITFVKQ